MGGEAQGRAAGVTVVIPCFNYGRFVRDAVESVFGQDGVDARVVVVDDGSTDGSAAACRACAGPRVEVICQENRGLPAARNRGAAAATGEFLLFLDADDWLLGGALAKLAAAIRGADNDGAGAAVSHAYGQQRMLGRGVDTVWAVPDWDPVLLMITNLHAVTALVRRERFGAVGGFDETMSGGYEDWDLWLRMAGRGWRGVRVREPLFVWRRHSDQSMISRAVASHEPLYRRLVANHAAMYERHADELIARMNLMLRRHDMNWLDETLEPIHLRGLHAQRARYEAMPSVRLHHGVHRAIGRLPRPIAAGARACLRAAGRALRGV